MACLFRPNFLTLVSWHVIVLECVVVPGMSPSPERLLRTFPRVILLFIMDVVS
jgi:hypothetical protein